MVLCFIPPNFRFIAEIFKELERERRSGRNDGRTDRRTDGRNDWRQYLSAPMVTKGKNGL